MPRPKLILLLWSAERVEKEIGVNRVTFLRACAEQDILPAVKGKYTSKQVFEALTGGLREQISRERLRLTMEQADKLAIEKHVTLGRLIPIDFVRERNEMIDTAIRAKIKASSMSATEKDDILRDIRELVGPPCVAAALPMAPEQLAATGSA